MGSKIRIPNPYSWSPVERHDRHRAYILVLHQESSEVIRLAESDTVTNANSAELFKGIEHKYLELVKQYPYPEYDIIQARAENLKELSGIFGATDGFDGVEVEKIASNQKYIHIISQDGSDIFLAQQDIKVIVGAIITNISQGDYGKGGKEVMEYMVSQTRHFVDGATNMFEQALTDAMFDELARR